MASRRSSSDRSWASAPAMAFGLPGGTLAISVPRWLPEIVNWKLSDDYHNAAGGHIRIYTAEELVDKVTKAGRSNDGTPGDAMVFTGRDYAHGLHSPYWWLKCAVGPTNDDHPLVKAYHRLLVWDIAKAPKATRWTERLLNPVLGKSLGILVGAPLVQQPRNTARGLGTRWFSPTPEGRARTVPSRQLGGFFDQVALPGLVQR